MQLEDRYVNPSVVPNFLDQDFSTVPPGDYLVQNVPFDEIEHVVDAVLPTDEQAAHLQITAPEPCLLLTRRTWTRTTPVDGALPAPSLPLSPRQPLRRHRQSAFRLILPATRLPDRTPLR